MHQTRVGIDADMRLHAKMPFVALLRLMHLGIAAVPGVPGRRRRLDNRRIDQRAFLHQQAAFAQRNADLVEQLARQVMLDQQAAELLQRGRVWHVLDRQIVLGGRCDDRRAE